MSSHRCRCEQPKGIAEVVSLLVDAAAVRHAVDIAKSRTLMRSGFSPYIASVLQFAVLTWAFTGLTACGHPVLASQQSLVLTPPMSKDTAAHIVLLAGDQEYRSEESLPMLAKILSQRHGFKTTVLFPLDPDGTINPDNTESLGDAQALDTADAVVMLLRWRSWPDEQMRHFVAAYDRGVPIIALRTSTHAFAPKAPTYRHFKGFGERVLGEDWVDHWGRHKIEATRGVIEVGAEDHPILRAVGEIFGDTDVYEAYPPADAQILLRGQVLQGMDPGDPPADYRRKRSTDGVEQGINDPMMPIVWARLHKSETGRVNRIFTTTMGAATDLQDESLRRLIVNAIYWGLDRSIPDRADVRFVDEYHPSPYGFGGFRKDLKPTDCQGDHPNDHDE